MVSLYPQVRDCKVALAGAREIAGVNEATGELQARLATYSDGSINGALRTHADLRALQTEIATSLGLLRALKDTRLDGLVASLLQLQEAIMHTIRY